MSTAGQTSRSPAVKRQIGARPSGGSTHAWGWELPVVSNTTVGSPARAAARAQDDARASVPDPGSPSTRAVSPAWSPPSARSTAVQPHVSATPGARGEAGSTRAFRRSERSASTAPARAGLGMGGAPGTVGRAAVKGEAHLNG